MERLVGIFQGGKMLVLSRHIGEKIVINNNIIVTITEVRSIKGKVVVKLGFEAPRHIPIVREELQHLDKGLPDD